MANTKNTVKISSKIVTISFLVLSPFILVGLLELGVRLAGLGIDTRPFVGAPGMPGYLTDNPELHKKYYASLTGAPEEETKPNLFTEKKPEGVVRGFVLGESTPQGFPFQSNQAFPKMAEAILNANSQGKKLEVINVAKTAMTSYYVRDMAEKLRAYNPDFLVIYSGHNEYYGNISESTGGSHWTRLSYLFLKESRVFQILSNWLASGEKSEGDATLMAERFAEKVFPPNQIKDLVVTDNYLDNIKSAIQTYNGSDVKIFLMSPVSNLVQMPPFVGPGNAETDTILKKAQDLISVGDFSGLKELVKSIPEKYRMFAQVKWLIAASAILNDGDVDQAAFISSKDEDEIPFRARSGLVSGLENMFSGEKVKNVSLINLPKELESRYGFNAFSNLMFLDHVHFNVDGQIAVAALLARSLNDQLALGANSSGLAATFSNRFTVTRSVAFNEIDELTAFASVSALFQDPPFSTMKLSYQYSKDFMLRFNGLYSDVGYRKFVAQPGDDPISEAMAYYRSQDREEKVQEILKSALWCNPGKFTPYLNMALYFTQFEDSADSIYGLWLRAWHLSKKDPEVKAKMIKALESASDLTLLEKVKITE